MRRNSLLYPDRLYFGDKRQLEDTEFGLPEKREFPIPDPAHIRAAESYFHYAKDADKPELARNILRKAARFGIMIYNENILWWAQQY